FLIITTFSAGSLVDPACFSSFGLHLYNPSQPLKIVSNGFERQFQLVSDQAQVAHPSVDLPLLKMRKDALDMGANPSLASVVAPIPIGELDVIGALLLDAVLDPVFAHPGFVGFCIVSFVAVNLFGLCRRDLFKEVTVLGLSSTDYSGANQIMLGIAADVGLVAVKASIVFARVTGIGIRRPTFSSGFDLRTLAAGFDQRRDHQGGAFDNVTALFQLGIEQAQKLLVQTTFDQSLPKTANG